jgi:hypothetical protein
MTSEPTKACVVMLKFEHKVWAIVAYPLKFIVACINFILQFINWCILGSLLRLFGIPLSVYCILKLIDEVSVIGANSPLNGTGIIYIFLIAISITGFIASWTDMPDNQKKIVLGDES